MNWKIQMGDDCFMDFEMNLVIKDGFPISVSNCEKRLLHKLTCPLEKLIPHRDLYYHIWRLKTNDYTPLYVLVNRVRRKIEDNPKHPKCLITIHKKGYIFYPRKITLKN